MSSDLVLTLNNGIKTVRGDGSAGAEAILLTSTVTDVEVGISAIPFELPDVQTNPPNPTGPFVAESGGIRVTRTGWYLIGSPIQETAPLAGFGAQVDTGVAPVPFPIEAGTLITIQANNMEGAPQGIENQLFWIFG